METTTRLSRSTRVITWVFFAIAGCGLYWALLNLTDSTFSRNLIGGLVCESNETLVEVKGTEYQQYNSEVGYNQTVQDVNLYCENSSKERRDVTSRILLLAVVNTIGGIVFSVITLLLLWSIRSRLSRRQRSQQLLLTET